MILINYLLSFLISFSLADQKDPSPIGAWKHITEENTQLLIVTEKILFSKCL